MQTTTRNLAIFLKTVSGYAKASTFEFEGDGLCCETCGHGPDFQSEYGCYNTRALPLTVQQMIFAHKEIEPRVILCHTCADLIEATFSVQLVQARGVSYA